MIFIVALIATGLILYRKQFTAELAGDDERILTTVLPMPWFRPLAGLSLYHLPRKWQHGLNVLLHIACSILVYRIAGQFGLSDPAICAVIYLVNPLANAAVCSIAGRYHMLGTFFTLHALMSALGGHVWTSLIMSVLATVSVEVGITSWILSIIFIPKMDGWMVCAYLLSIGVLVAWRAHIFTSKEQGLSRSTEAQRNGLPGALPPLTHIPVFLTESFKSHCQWLAGFGFRADPVIYHPNENWILWAVNLALIGPQVIIWHDSIPHQWRIALCLLLITPWWIYMALPLSDLYLEQRAYGSVFGIALAQTLFLGLLPSPALMVAVVWLVSITARRSFMWASFQSYNQMAYNENPKRVKTRILQNLAVAHSREGNAQKAIELSQRALGQSPNCWPVMKNLAVWYRWCGLDEEARAMDARAGLARQRLSVL